MKRIVAAGLLWSWMYPANAQSIRDENTILFEKQMVIQNQYQQYMGAEAPLFNGALYVDYTHTVSGSLPFWNNTRDFIKGDISYKNILYKGVLMNYDVYKDKLLIQHPVNYKIFEVQQKDIAWFDLTPHRFSAIQFTEKGLRPGFYEVVYNGRKSAVYGKHSKELSQDLSENATRHSFVSRCIYYVYRDGQSFRITTMKNLLQAYKNEEVKSYIKNKKFNVKKDMQTVLKSVALYYDQL
ncbi:hypothetical protein ACTJIJ_18820 [Niabella sp. 22666]|uniref:hypothetical protein n=1 Tax=Niabella sp. 22666 TaxID=3453954 RepID=UPI003F82AC31